MKLVKENKMNEEVPTITKAKKPIEIYTDMIGMIRGQSCQDISRALRFVSEEVERKMYSIDVDPKYNQMACSTGVLGSGFNGPKDIKF